MSAKGQLVDLLHQEGTVAPEHLQRALERRAQTGEPVAAWLVRHRIVAEDDLFFLMSRSLRVPPIPEERLKHLTLHPGVRRRVPPDLAREHVLLPLDLDEERSILSVAMFDPSDREAMERLGQLAGVKHVKVYLARRSVILKALDTIYSGIDDILTSETVHRIDRRGEQRGEEQRQEEKRREEVSVVEVIPGKVSIESALAREIAEMSQIAASESAPSGIQVASVERPTAKPPTEKPPAERRPAERRPIGGRAEAITERFVRGAAVEPKLEREASRETAETEPIAARSLLETPLLSPTDEGKAASSQPALLESAFETATTSELPAFVEFEDGEGGHWAQAEGHVSDEQQGGEAFVASSSRRAHEVNALMWELMASVGALTSMLEESLDPGGATARTYGTLGRLVARELGMDSLTVARIALAASLYGLDAVVRVNLTEGARRVDVYEAFAGSAPTGGLSPTLRALGARALGLLGAGGDHGRGKAASGGVTVLRVIADYVELRAQLSDETASLDSIERTLTKRGVDEGTLGALFRAVEEVEGIAIRTERIAKEGAPQADE